jgi:hypothetical protein
VSSYAGPNFFCPQSERRLLGLWATVFRYPYCRSWPADCPRAINDLPWRSDLTADSCEIDLGQVLDRFGPIWLTIDLRSFPITISESCHWRRRRCNRIPIDAFPRGSRCAFLQQKHKLKKICLQHQIVRFELCRISIDLFGACKS